MRLTRLALTGVVAAAASGAGAAAPVGALVDDPASSARIVARVPEPTPLVLLGAAFVLLALWMRRRRKPGA